MASDPRARALLRLPIHGPQTAAALTRAFGALQASYGALVFHGDLQDRVIRIAKSKRAEDFEAAFTRLAEGQEWVRHGRFEPPWAWWGAFSDSLVVVRLEFRSPGFGDVSGIGGPLETLRKTRVDRDERRKDKEWREELDREQQECGNCAQAARGRETPRRDRKSRARSRPEAD